jgi:hypothetical protein
LTEGRRDYCKILREQAFHDRELKSHYELAAQRKDHLRRVRQSGRHKQRIRNTSFHND